jgi:hypothetical protein
MNDGAHFEIIVNGVPRTYRDRHETAIAAAIYYKQRLPMEDVRIRDLRDDSVVNIGWKDGKAFVMQQSPAQASGP